MRLSATMCEASKWRCGLAAILLSVVALTAPGTLEAQVTQTPQQPLPIAPQPADLPPAAPNAPFAVTVVTYQFAPPNSYSFNFIGGGAGKAMGNVETGTGN